MGVYTPKEVFLIEIVETPQSQLAAAISSLGTNQFKAHLAKWLSTCVPCDNMTWLAYYQNRPPELLMAQSRQSAVHDRFEDIYLSGAYLLDPFHNLHIQQAPRGVYRLTDIAPDKFYSNRYFTEYYRNTTLIDEIAFIAYPSPGVSIHLSLGRDSSSNKRYSFKTFSTAKQIAPIVSSLVEIHWVDLSTTGEYEEADTIARVINAVRDQHDIQLSLRQAEVAILILRGHSSISIGLQLGISMQTVKVFRKQLYKKCGISSQAELFNMLLPLLGTQVTEP